MSAPLGIPRIHGLRGTSRLPHFGEGRGLANRDIENDGDQDVVIFCNNEPMALFRNDLAAAISALGLPL